MGTVLNIAGNYYGFNYSKTPQEADIKAFNKDWETVSKDLLNSTVCVWADKMPIAQKE